MYHLTHTPISFVFSSNARDFVVRENALYEPSGRGEHLYIFVRKKNLSTFALVNIFSQILGVKAQNIGYAGLKDKYATTYQFLSIPRNKERALSENLVRLEEQNIKILSVNAHENKLRTGHLKSNTFFMRLKKVTPLHAQKLCNVLSTLTKEGIPNYFGAQRFGKNGDNHKEGEQILENLLHFRNKKIEKFLRSSFQSYLFNLWLQKRVRLSKYIESFSVKELLEIEELRALGLGKNALDSLKTQTQFFKLFSGDVAMHYPYGKVFVCGDLRAECERFVNRLISPAGALSGKKLFKSKDVAHMIEEPFLDSRFSDCGSRRYAWVWAEGIEFNYKKEEAQFDLHFTLPKGSYATTFLEAVKNEKLESCLEV
ncbi:tRNA pseudouridine(13) synthase TruD [Helicobacter himalayensis]|uniref:tRNA pseudouridine(13) synthase TruD n=1 Tax=Helicobacter himalayensis TaxID=1591088 RepID=UPI00083115D3|nr:tRNA pseudouridine(13) synthase TruD [Helicobacter himalayensis]